MANIWDGLLADAAAEIRGQLRQLRRGASWQLIKVLDYLDEHLFDRGLGVGGIAAGCGLGRRDLQRLFNERLGSPPRDYLRARRMETAANLLRDTDLAIHQIAEAVGYASLQSFHKIFTRWAGEPPAAYRRRHPPGRRALPLHQPQFRRRLSRGEVPAEQAALAIRYLETLYPSAAGAAPAAAGEKPDPRFHDEATAQAVWRRIDRQPAAEQLQTVRCQYGLRTPALFELLLEKSRQAGDPRRRLELAELARRSLEPTAAALGHQLPDLEARAWARLGEARHALGEPGAEEAHERAEVAWSVPRPRRDPQVLAEIYDLEASLRRSQGRVEEARAASGRAQRIRGAAPPDERRDG